MAIIPYVLSFFLICKDIEGKLYLVIFRHINAFSNVFLKLSISENQLVTVMAS